MNDKQEQIRRKNEWHKWNLMRSGVSVEEVERMMQEGLGPFDKPSDDKSPVERKPKLTHFILPQTISSEDAAKAIQDMVKRRDDSQSLDQE